MKALRLAFFALFIALIAPGRAAAGAPIKALIVDGQNNHDWRASTPHLKRVLEATGLFTVEVATAPGKGTASLTFARGTASSSASAFIAATAT